MSPGRDLLPVVHLRNLEVERGEAGRLFELEVPEFVVLPGELVAVVGPSGCGKSTLLDLLALILPPRKFERMVIGGEEIPVKNFRMQGAADRRTRIGFVLQHGALLPFLNVRDNIRLGAALGGNNPDPLFVEDLTSRLGLTGLEHAFPGKISGGQRQRTALARALAAKPPLLLADEPTGSVDPLQAEDIGELLRTLSKENSMATVLVTHDRELAEKFADRIVSIQATSPHPALIRSRVIVP
jgi:putative ABC transport system ATP-binding protein